MAGCIEGKKRAPGELAPSQFASCIERGLNVHAYDKMTVEAKVKAGSKVASKSPNELIVSPFASKSRVIPDNATIQSVREKNANYETGHPDFPRVECTNGAMEALRLCHSAFLSTLSSTLGDLESSSSAKLKLLTENDVMACMEQMELSNLAHRAMESLAGGDGIEKPKRKKPMERKFSGGDDVKTTKRMRPIELMSGGDDIKQSNRSERRKKKTFADFEGTREELIAEQDRLLLDSASRVQMMMDDEIVQGGGNE